MLLVKMVQEKVEGDSSMEYIEIKEQIKQKLPVARDFGDERCSANRNTYHQ